VNKTPQEVDKELRAMKGDVAKLSKWMVDNAPNELSKEIAQKIKERLDVFAKHNVRFKFSIYSGGRRATKDGGICKTRFTRDAQGT
jgi:3-methyladenine DNA glycosylase AlkC